MVKTGISPEATRAVLRRPGGFRCSYTTPPQTPLKTGTSAPNGAQKSPLLYRGGHIKSPDLIQSGHKNTRRLTAGYYVMQFLNVCATSAYFSPWRACCARQRQAFVASLYNRRTRYTSRDKRPHIHNFQYIQARIFLFV